MVAFSLGAMLSACTIYYKAVGKYTDGSEKFVGDVAASVFGGGDVVMRSASSSAECTGRTENTSAGFTCSGQTGTVELQCTDGRAITGTWTATSCTTGVGTGQDSDGHPFEFIFGLTEKEANDFLAQ